MKRKYQALLCLLLAALLLLCAGCNGANTDEQNQTETYLIGVEVYDTTDPEMLMFFNYYKNYIAESFPVEFLLSGSINTAEEEQAFVEEMKAQGASGIISFFVADLEQVVAACEENELYYVMGSSSLTDEEFESVKDNSWFLGVIGPSSQEEYDAGVTMAEHFISQGATEFLILSGGAGDMVNTMHYNRVQGMLDTLADQFDLDLDSETLAAVTELTEVDTGTEDVTIVLSPGYVQVNEGQSNLKTALSSGNYDALMSAVSISSILDLLKEEIQSSESALLVGVVDCFSQENYEAVEWTDSQGQSLLNFVHGKYASMVAPAFVAMFNAVAGDVDLVNPDGTAFRLYQSYWTAADEAEYAELYGYTQSIYQNAYSSSDLMQVIRLYNPDATYEEFAALAESSDIDSVLARLEE